jgi:hypothetical protein
MIKQPRFVVQSKLESNAVEAEKKACLKEER